MHRRYIFCCTFRRLAPPRCYLAPCPGSPDFPPEINSKRLPSQLFSSQQILQQLSLTQPYPTRVSLFSTRISVAIRLDELPDTAGVANTKIFAGFSFSLYLRFSRFHLLPYASSRSACKVHCVPAQKCQPQLWRLFLVKVHRAESTDFFPLQD